MKKTIRLIITDLDESLLTRDNRMPDENLRTLKAAQEAGIPVTLASGRMFRAMLPAAQKLDLRLPLVAYNGAMIRDPQGERTIRFHQGLGEEQSRQLLEILHAQGAHIQGYLDDELYVERDDNRTAGYAKKDIDSYHVVPSLSSQRPGFTKLLIIEEDPEKMKAIRRACSVVEGVGIVQSSAIYCEFLSGKINKGTGLEFLCRYLQIDPAQVLAFGDQENDIPLLKTAGIGIAMGNAVQALKDAADDIAPPVEEAGLARMVRK
ncbi:MAG: HAD family hydrolase, partial [Spirochaetales bacterium]|nr:HAD family hydrolase [Spirochaetales bacterium]